MAGSSPTTMRAAVVHKPGGPEALILQDLPVPVPTKGQILIRIRAFGLNRSEMWTRMGDSPGIKFPRVLGIEAAGTVASAPGGEFATGAVVATVVGGMGRNYDGGYAEYTMVPAGQVKEIKEEGLSWGMLGALPEMVHTAWGALFTSLCLQRGETLLIRGGSSSVGLATAALARHHGAFVIGTTRSKDREQLLKDSGVQDVIIDNGAIEEETRKRYPKGVDKVLELVGVTTLADSLKLVRKNGVVCTAGIVGGKWTMEEFTPALVIPSGVYLTTYSSFGNPFSNTPLDDVARLIKDGSIHIPIKTFRLEQIVDAHRIMDEGTAEAKMVVLTD